MRISTKSFSVGFGMAYAALVAMAVPVYRLSALPQPGEEPCAAEPIAHLNISFSSRPGRIDQAEFWEWAWGTTYTDDAVMFLNETPGAPGNWVVTANQCGVDIGQAAFQSAAWFDFFVHDSSYFDESTEVTVGGSVTLSAVPGLLTTSFGVEVPVMAATIQFAASSDLISDDGVAFTFFVPEIQTTSVADAIDEAMRLQRRGQFPTPSPVHPQELSSLPGEGSPFLSTGYAPCIEGVPLEEQNCQCRCGLERGQCESACFDAFQIVLGACLAPWLAVVWLCYVGCLALGPGFIACFTPCVIALGKQAAACYVAARAVLEGCDLACRWAYEDCIADCQ